MYTNNKTVLLRDSKRRTARAPPTSKSFQNVCPFLCPKFCPFFVQNFCPFFVQIYFGGGVTPGCAPQVGGYPRRLLPSRRGVPPGAPPPTGGYPWAPSWGGVPRGPLPQLGVPPGGPPSWGVPLGAPSWGGTTRGPPQLGGTPGGTTQWGVPRGSYSVCGW